MKVRTTLLTDVVSEKYTKEQVKCKGCISLCTKAMYVVTAALQRKYESMRRQWRVDGKENSAELIEVQAKMNKYRARRIRV